MLIDFENEAVRVLGDAKEDIEAAECLLELDKPRHARFFAHLGLEKALKGLVARATHSTPPKVHDLKRLAKVAGLKMDQETEELLGAMNYYQMASRYLEARGHEIQVVTARRHLQKARELFEWLTGQ
ncbi:MAG: HEPN domain-containing protein [Candidatus Coatesbacteria bacterium]|nr:HEPN domain-containing protein [Candidatus Coatesbacteria bacterium]